MTTTANPCASNYVPPVYDPVGVKPYQGAATVVPVGGTPVIALYGPMLGGLIANPLTTQDQGIAPIIVKDRTTVTRNYGVINSMLIGAPPEINGQLRQSRVIETDIYGPAEILYVDFTKPADLFESATTRAVYPGESIEVPDDCDGNVWVNAATSGHRFVSIVFQPPTQYPPTAYNGEYPPSGPVGATKTLPSYIYDQYSDDDDIVALIDAQNQNTQAFLDWFNNLNLPIYTKQQGALLDWVGQGLYGIVRPTLYSNQRKSLGAINSFVINGFRIAINESRTINNITNLAVTDDDVYKRILTWHLYKGDGKQVTTEWLKRRVLRFLYGRDGGDYEGPSDGVSVIVSSDTISITIVSGLRQSYGGALINTSVLNGFRPNQVRSRLTLVPIPSMALIFKEAIDTGALPLPQQYSVSCRIAPLGVLPDVAAFHQ